MATRFACGCALLLSAAIPASVFAVADSEPPEVRIRAPDPGNEFISSPFPVPEIVVEATDNGTVTAVELQLAREGLLEDGCLELQYQCLDGGTGCTADDWFPAQQVNDRDWRRDQGGQADPLLLTSGGWTLTARAIDAADPPNIGSDAIHIPVAETALPSQLTLQLSSHALLTGGSLDLAGRLTAPGTDLQLGCRTLSVTVTAPDGSETVKEFEILTADLDGNYSLTGLGGAGLFPGAFDRGPGLYAIEIDFPGTPLLNQNEAHAVVEVKRAPGYALLVQGGSSDHASHRKTLNRVYAALQARGLGSDDIVYLGHGSGAEGVDGSPTLEALQVALSQTLASAAALQPAPLLVVLVGHGAPGVFQLVNGTLTPALLDGALADFEGALLNADPPGVPVQLVLGFNDAGSFVAPLARPGDPPRTVIASSAVGPAFTGPLEPPFDGSFDGIPGGDAFVEQLFARLARGTGYRAAFTAATAAIEAYTARGADVPPQPSRYLDQSLQHPLLEDDGGEGSNALSAGVTADGEASRHRYLGVGLDHVPGAPGNAAEILAVTPTRFLAPEEVAATLALLPGAADATAWAEVRAPAQVLAAAGGTLQQPAPFVHLPLQPTGGDCADCVGVDPRDPFVRVPWSPTVDAELGAVFDDFSAVGNSSGRYEIYLYLRDELTGTLAPPVRSIVYKDRAGNQPPLAWENTACDLNNPATSPWWPCDEETPSLVVVFNWTPTTDPDGDALTYTLRIAKEEGLDCPMVPEVYRREELKATRAAVPFGVLESQQGYCWQVDAVDAFGASVSSPVFRFQVGDRRTVSGILQGIVYSDLDYARLLGAELTLTGLDGLTITTTTEADGSYVVDADPGTYTLTLAGTVPEQDAGSVVIDTTEPLTVNLAATTRLDIDGNRAADAQTDGLLVLRYLFGFRAAALLDGVVAAGADPERDIESHLAGMFGLLDIDDNGRTAALTDGLLVQRYLLGLRGAALTDGAVAGDANPARDIQGYLQRGLVP